MESLVHALLSGFDEDAFARVQFNDVEVDLPAGTLLTMWHCMHLVEGHLKLYVETPHWRWLLDRLEENGLFIDIGASTGAMTVPFGLRHPAMEIFAFEPAARARRLLMHTLERNGVRNVVVSTSAISDRLGSATFVERPVDLTGVEPWQPESSVLARRDEPIYDGDVVLPVLTTTLDALAEERGWTGRRIVVKMDIEDYETFALRGASRFITNNVVFFTIDLHESVEHGGQTGDDCRAQLAKFGYTFADLGHVLLCTPPDAAVQPAA